jgi:hypothetical protein
LLLGKRRIEIEAILADKNGTMVFNQVPAIMMDLLTLTGQTAASLSREECGKMLTTMRDLLRQLDQEVSLQFRKFRKWNQGITTQYK